MLVISSSCNLVPLGIKRWQKPNRGINSGEALATHRGADAGLTSPLVVSTFQSFVDPTSSLLLTLSLMPISASEGRSI